MSTNNNFLIINKQHIINYYYNPPKDNNFTIVFLIGYMSDISGEKALFLKEYCSNLGLGYLTFEYRGHGNSSGELENFYLEDWLDDVIITINYFTKKNKKILIGSSMGGWLAFLYSLKHKELVKAIIGIAPALDFTNELIKHKANLIEDVNNPKFFIVNNLDNTKSYISKKLINSSKELLLLNSEYINLNIPIRILHGIKDVIVPYSKSLLVSERLISKDVRIILVKNGDHRLSSKEDLQLLEITLNDLVINHK